MCLETSKAENKVMHMSIESLADVLKFIIVKICNSIKKN